MKKYKDYLIILIFIALFFFILFTNKLPSELKDKNILITEIMALNKTTITDSDLDYSDYIELYNNTDNEINLKNYFLSDDDMSSKKWVFPEIIINPKEYLVVFISGKDKCDLVKRECHTNFKLNKKGETVSLLNSDGFVINNLGLYKIDQEVLEKCSNFFEHLQDYHGV